MPCSHDDCEAPVKWRPVLELRARRLGRAGELVELYQRAVRAVARELLAAGELSGSQIEKIVERNLP